MRRLRMAMLVGSATILFAGCSSGRAISNPFASGNAAVQSAGPAAYAEQSYNNEYESDPGGQATRVASEPEPVPPARGISLTKQISHTTTVGHRRQVAGCVNEPTCVAPQTCVQQGCGTAPQCVDNMSKRRGLLGWFCPARNDCPQPAACVQQPSCCIPQYVQPRANGCQTRKTCASCYSGRGLFGRMFGCFAKAGAYCRPDHGPTCEAPGCGYTGSGAQQYIMAPAPNDIMAPAVCEKSNTMPQQRSDDYDRSPLADLEKDPFAQPAVSPDQEARAKTPVPDPPSQSQQKPLPPAAPVGKPLQTNDLPHAPESATAPMPLQPSAGEPQAWQEPTPWHRLQTPSSTSLAIQPRSFNVQATSWPQR